jgi:hypothetical protein
VLASVASLTAVLQRAFTDQLDPHEIGHEVSRRWTNGLDRAMRLRQSGRVSADRFFDVHYHELLRDPMMVIGRIYAHFDVPLTEDASAAMRRFLAANPKDKHGAHRYSLSTFGLEADDLVRRFKAYREYYGVPREEASSQ